MAHFGVGAAGLAAQWARPLLPAEPRIPDRLQQERLTAEHLMPCLAEVEAFFLGLRARLDPVLQARKPHKLGKPYPLGQCLEISLAAQEQLPQVREAELTAAQARGLQAVRALLRAGGTWRRVWGDLRGEFFQNAFQLGSLYVDVSNDTVVPTKPKVEILPFEQSRLHPVRDHLHYATLAQRYWGHETFANHAVPELAPWAPLLHRRSDGRFELHAANRYMMALTQLGAFASSEAAVGQASLPGDVLEAVTHALGSVAEAEGLQVATDAVDGRRRALQACRQARQRRQHQVRGHSDRVSDVIHRLNLRLLVPI